MRAIKSCGQNSLNSRYDSEHKLQPLKLKLQKRRIQRGKKLRVKKVKLL